jgi:hypothetical protein
MVVFSKLDKVHLCSVAVKNQVISMFGGETNFNKYLQTCRGKFYSASAEKYATCCHPEALLNKQYCNEHTPGYATTWDKMYSDIRNDLGVSLKCDLAKNIIDQVKGSVSFELMLLAAKEKNKRNSERLLALSELGQHPWQQPEFIERNSKRNREQESDRQLALSSVGEHNFQRKDVVESNRKRQLTLFSVGEHNFQREDVVEKTSKRELENFSNGTHNFQESYKKCRSAATGGTGLWTDEEDIELTRLVRTHGMKWAKINKEMHGECSCPHVGLCFGVAILNFPT